MKIRHLLAIAATMSAAASASAFEWNPQLNQPVLDQDITQASVLEQVSFKTGEWFKYSTTDLTPIWKDEDGNEIKGTISTFADGDFDDFYYNFNVADFKTNGEYELIFPEGLIKNAAGELSDPLTFYFTILLPELGGSTGMFEDFKVLSVSPNLEEPQGLWQDQKIIVNTNHNDAIGYVTFTVIDNEDKEALINAHNFYLGSMRQLGDPSPIEFEVANTYKFTDDRTYTAEFTFYNGTNDHDQDGNETPVVGRQSYTFTGKAESFKYSAIKLESILPDPKKSNITDPSLAVFTLTFTGPVNVYRVATPKGMFGEVAYPSSCFSSNEDKTVWTINLSDQSELNEIDADLCLNIYVKDLEGYQLKGNEGLEDQSHYEYNWPCDIGAPELEIIVPNNGEMLDVLTEVTIKSKNGDDMTWSYTGTASIMNLQKDLIGTLVFNESEIPDVDPNDPDGSYDASGSKAKEYTFNKWKPAGSDEEVPLYLVKEGSYQIEFTQGCFTFGEELSSQSSKSCYSGFSISGIYDDEPDDPVVDPSEQETLEYTSVTPANGTKVESIKTIRLTFPEENVSFNGGENLPVLNADKEEVTTASCDYDWDDWDASNVILVILKKEITEDGVYTIVIPARTIGNAPFIENDGKTGICNPEITLTYTIGEGTSAVESVDASADVDVYDINGRIILKNASAADVKALDKGIYIINGKKVVK